MAAVASLELQRVMTPLRHLRVMDPSYAPAAAILFDMVALFDAARLYARSGHGDLVRFARKRLLQKRLPRSLKPNVAQAVEKIRAEILRRLEALEDTP